MEGTNKEKSGLYTGTSKGVSALVTTSVVGWPGVEAASGKL